LKFLPKLLSKEKLTESLKLEVDWYIIIVMETEILQKNVNTLALIEPIALVEERTRLKAKAGIAITKIP